jgi:hypothetical protein
VIEDCHNSFLNFPHQEPGSASTRRVMAIRACVSVSFTDARERYDRTVDNTDDGTDRYPVRRIPEVVAALRSALTLQDASVLQFEENRLKKACRGIRMSRNMLDQDRTLSILTRQEVKRSQRVLAFSR